MQTSRKLRFLILVFFCLTILLGCYADSSLRPERSITEASLSSGPTHPSIYNIKDFGAKGDGVTDDSKAIQKAADTARDKKGSLFVPAGNYLLKRTVRFYTSVDCQGKFLLQNGNDATIDVARWTHVTEVSPATLTGLTRGSTRIIGLNGFKGSTAVIKSGEKLVDREMWGRDYTKNDTVEITSSDGRISPALDCTFKDRSCLTIDVYEYEEPIVLSNLKVESMGDAAGSNHLVYCYRSNVTFKNPVIANISRTGTAGCGLDIYDSVNVTISNPIITNFRPAGSDGYGIALGGTANINIFNGKITACSNHAITGRHDKNVLIRGGIYEGNISALDDHWGNNFQVEGAVLIGEIGITYAGTDISIRNCAIRDCTEILTVRMDTPQLMGRVVVEDITAKIRKGYKTMYCYRASSQETAVPDRVSISNVTADIPGDGFLYYNEINTDNASDYAGKMIFKNIQTVGGVGTIITGH